MPWFIVKQPNGKLARFSTVVDSFTHLDMTEADALEYCGFYLPPLGAETKVRRAIEDLDVRTDSPGDGLHRWNECLATMRAVNPKELAALEREYPDIFAPPHLPTTLRGPHA